MEKSDKINELAKALSNFQLNQKKIGYNSTNPFLKNKYADLTALIEGAKENLHKNGLAVSQILNGNGVYTILMHESGEWIGDTFKIEPTDGKGTNGAQEMGIAITYSRRYAYASILGLVTDEDTDGVRKMQPSTTKPKLLPNTDQWKNAVIFLASGGDKENIDKYEITEANKKALLHEAKV